jgi:hypothetical protein
MKKPPALLSWLRSQIRIAVKDGVMVWGRPKAARFEHARLALTSKAAICGRYASDWDSAPSRRRFPKCDDCLSLIQRATNE